jgi:hypothetical protein
MPQPLPSSPGPVALLDPGPRPGTPVGTTPWACVICPRSAPEPGGCCSAACADEASRELDRNLRALRRRRAGPGSAAGARRLAERSGHLSSALLRWHPRDGQRPLPPAGKLPSGDLAVTP